MRPDMDEFDVEWMEQRLRRAAIGHSPAAPAALGDFVDSVPGRYKRASRLQLVLERPRVRRGVFAVAVAAAVVLATIGSAAFVSFRQPSGPAASSTPAGTVSDGWAWQATDGTLYFAEMDVPNGFIANCGRNTAQGIVEQTLCSSPDGLRWSVPADPAIVSFKGTDPFLPYTILVRSGTYLATSSRGAGTFQGPAQTMWRSTDGVHWGEVDTSKSPGATIGLNLMVVVPDGFLAEVSTNQAGSPPEQGLFISSDGQAWAKAGDLPFETRAAGSGYYLGPTLTAGLYAAGQGPDRTATGTWRTTNGRAWEVVTLPAGYSELGSVVTLPDGGLRGVASSFDTAASNVMVSSTDGLSWQIDRTAPTGSVDALVLVGDRMVAYVSSTSYTNPHQVLQSDDWGKSWRPLLDLAGQPVSGSVGTLGGRLEIRDTDGVAHWLLTPVQRGAATSEPSTTAPAESPSAGELPSPLESPSAEPSLSAAPSDLPSPTTEAPVGSPSDPPGPTPESSTTTSP